MMNRFSVLSAVIAGITLLTGCTASPTPLPSSPPPTVTLQPTTTAKPPSTTPAPAPTPSIQPLPMPTAQPTPVPPPLIVKPVSFTDSGYTELGTWAAEAGFDKSAWQPGDTLSINTTLKIYQNQLEALAAAGIKPDGFIVLVTAERTFDSEGWLRLSSDERMSTLLTPTGLAIEGGVQGAVTNRFGYDWRTPVDELATLPMVKAQVSGNMTTASFTVNTKIPADIPPGIYRLRFDYGVTVKNKNYSLNGEAFAKRPFFKGQPTCSEMFSPPIPTSGKNVSGTAVNAALIQPRVPWIILANYNSNGYRGVIADEDKTHFALSNRNLIPDQVILPLYDDAGKVLSYSLEPQFPADAIEARTTLPWDYAKGEISVQVTGPDGKTADLGTAPFVGKQGQWPTTKKSTITAWKPSTYGQYTVKVTGWIADTTGNKFTGGGTYHFWIAKRMTMATATFQGFAYPVGTRYGRDIGFAPAVPADVQVTATLYVNSDPTKARSITYSGKASPSGIYGAAQGMQSFPLDAPGEYRADILAKYMDKDGHLWVCAMTHSGVVYAEDSPITARGKKVTVNGKPVDRGDTNFEGYVDNTTSYLAHINYPFLAGDVLMIASDHQGANKIEPVLTYETKVNPATYDPNLQTIGITNLKLRTSNGYSPHMFPEFITDWNYYYAGAPRPGFMSRFIVAENGTRAPYWPVSPNAFGGQINASNNGDLPGDIYRLIGGVVVRKKGETPAYAGYLASAFLLPRGTKDNRVIAPGSEDITGSDGSRARFFLVGLRPGMMYEVGTAFAPAVQIDPVLPVNVTFVMTYPDGRVVTAQGTGDSFGTFVGKDRWPLDLPGVYKFTLNGEWQGYKGTMPGLPKEGGEFYVVEKDRPANAPTMKINLPEQSKFPVTGNLSVTGTSTGKVVHFAAVIPGAVLGMGDIPVVNGKWEYTFKPAEFAALFPTYDIINLVNGKPEIADVVHLSFFSTETAADGKTWSSFKRLIIRGTVVINAE